MTKAWPASISAASIFRAARDYGLTYPDLKRLTRNSLEYGSLLGESL